MLRGASGPFHSSSDWHFFLMFLSKALSFFFFGLGSRRFLLPRPSSCDRHRATRLSHFLLGPTFLMSPHPSQEDHGLVRCPCSSGMVNYDGFVPKATSKHWDCLTLHSPCRHFLVPVGQWPSSRPDGPFLNIQKDLRSVPIERPVSHSGSVQAPLS